MTVIPASKTRQYMNEGPDEIVTSPAGSSRYFKEVLLPTLVGQQLGRIILVDHSGSGRSVDGFHEAFLDAAYSYAYLNADTAGTEDPSAVATQLREYYKALPCFLINVVDYDRRPDGPRSPVNPLHVPVLDTITQGKSGEVNALVGDKKAHPRVIPEYPPNKWETPVKDNWKSGEEAMATKMRSSIMAYNRINGGPIGSPEKREPSKTTKFFSGFPDDVRNKLKGT
jgi:hypothetical protein